ncbi:DUF262 domain-containing protein [Sphingomonas sp.]|uniref:GmrSD restriction endonuclease domain-containing protein n=1 Tax=Sphingomonas sp. TaxID=28214 RepID=UPI0031DB34AE
MADNDSGGQDLIVRGDSVERTYSNYRDRRYVVNRAYQRKLIWTLDEKQKFIDSVLRGYPVPLILLAEDSKGGSGLLEIIDGMQRLNAIMSFIQNEYSVHDSYFDLNTMAVTKSQLDAGELEQRNPILDREECVRLASYVLPFSIYEFADTEAVNTVFRRINSGGRKLSRQELRTAGANGHFATAVRRIASRVRGDASHGDTLRLNEMGKISITNRDLNYGIAVEDIFWVKQGILTKEQVRESRDEELIADILAYMVSDSPVSSRSEFTDAYFGMLDDDAAQTRYRQIETNVQKRGADLVISDFQRTFDELKLTIETSGQTLTQLLLGTQVARAPRYFQAIFLAFYKLIVRDGMKVANRQTLIGKMKNSGQNIVIAEGGAWVAEQRQAAVHSAAGIYGDAFTKATGSDPALIHWVSRFENLLAQSLTEQSAYDFKQGFLRLDGNNQFDEECFDNVLRTAVGISNIRKDYIGYIVIGVAENIQTAKRVQELYDIQPVVFASYYVTGLDHEATALGKNQDKYFQMIVEKVLSSKVSSPLREYLARHLRTIRYYDKTIFVFEIQSQEDPSNYEGRYYDRTGAQLKEVDPANLPTFIRRYIGGL